MNNDLRLALWVSLAIVFCGSCFCQPAVTQTKRTDDTAIQLPEKLDWKPVADLDQESVRVVRFKLTKPRPLNVVVAEISVSSELEIVVTPGNGDKNLETTGLKTSTFLKNHRCDVAINAGPFQPVHLLENREHDVRGLQIADGDLVSKGQPSTPVLVFDQDGRAQILAKPPKTTKGIHNAVSGFGIVLKKGTPLGDTKTLHPRTAVGINKEGNKIFLLVVDGRQKGVSEGAAERELGELLGKLGCHGGINLDGGGTSTIVIAAAEGKQTVLNVPIHGGVPGLERPSASHLGFRFPRKKSSRKIK